jgi:hypothetical protein
VSEFARGLDEFLGESRVLKATVDRQEKEIALLKKKLSTAHQWKNRLTEKVSVLEAARPWGPDGWDEKFLFDQQMTVKFTKRWRSGDERSHRIALVPKVGRKTVVIGGHNEALLCKAIEEMNGRKRTGPEQQKAPGVPKKKKVSNKKSRGAS